MISSKYATRPMDTGEKCEYCGGRYLHLSGAVTCAECHTVFWLHPHANYVAKLEQDEMVVLAFEPLHGATRGRIVGNNAQLGYATRITIARGNGVIEEWPSTAIVIPLEHYSVFERYGLN